MHEQSKIDESKHFLAQMEQSQLDSTAFRFNVSAFLNASRSVLQYAYKEVDKSCPPKKWYEDSVSGDDVIKVLRDERNLNIHTKPTEPPGTFESALSSELCFQTGGTIENVRDGRVIQHTEFTDPPTSPKPPNEAASTTVKYFFDGWDGEEDVLTLCRDYVRRLEQLVQDGQKRGFLTP
jgi:hypothetical protein